MSLILAQQHQRLTQAMLTTLLRSGLTAARSTMSESSPTAASAAGAGGSLAPSHPSSLAPSHPGAADAARARHMPSSVPGTASASSSGAGSSRDVGRHGSQLAPDARPWVPSALPPHHQQRDKTQAHHSPREYSYLANSLAMRQVSEDVLPPIHPVCLHVTLSASCQAVRCRTGSSWSGCMHCTVTSTCQEGQCTCVRHRSICHDSPRWMPCTTPGL